MFTNFPNGNVQMFHLIQVLKSSIYLIHYAKMRHFSIEYIHCFRKHMQI